MYVDVIYARGLAMHFQVLFIISAPILVYNNNCNTLDLHPVRVRSCTLLRAFGAQELLTRPSLVLSRSLKRGRRLSTTCVRMRLVLEQTLTGKLAGTHTVCMVVAYRDCQFTRAVLSLAGIYM